MYRYSASADAQALLHDLWDLGHPVVLWPYFCELQARGRLDDAALTSLLSPATPSRPPPQRRFVVALDRAMLGAELPGRYEEIRPECWNAPLSDRIAVQPFDAALTTP